MDKPNRKIPSSAEAFPLANRGRQILAGIERLNLTGNQILDEAIKNVLGRRTLVGADGSTLKIFRGQVDRIEAHVPQPAPVKKPEEGGQLPGGSYLCINVWTPGGWIFAGVILIPIEDLSQPAQYVPLASIHTIETYLDQYAGVIYKDDFTSEYVDLIGFAGPAHELLGNFLYDHRVSGGSSYAQDWDESTGGADGIYHRNQEYTTWIKIVDTGVKISPADKVWTAETIIQWEGQTYIDATGPTTYRVGVTYTDYVDYMGYQTKVVLNAPPNTVYPKYVIYGTGTRTFDGEGYVGSSGAYIDANEHAFVTSYAVYDEIQTLDFTETTRTLENFVASGANKTISPLCQYYSSDRMWTINSGYNGVSTYEMIPIVAINNQGVTTQQLQVDGQTYQVSTYATDDRSATWNWINHYRYPHDDDRLCSFSYREYGPDDWNIENFLMVGVVTNGVLQTRKFYETSEDIFDFDGQPFSTDGYVRILVVNPLSREERV